MSLHNRLVTLERNRLASASMPPLILFSLGSEPTPEQQIQIDHAESQGRKVILFCSEMEAGYEPA